MSPFFVMLLASLGPMLVGFVGLNDDDDAQTEAGDENPQESPDDPVAMIDVATFIENARNTSDDTGTVEQSRGTDADEDFTADAQISARHDASGGKDRLTGSDLNDTLSGGDGADVVRGGDGDDALFGAFSRESRADDEQPDTLDGGAGDDALFLGDGDSANGGEGRDVFAATQDAIEVITINDFDPAEDAVVIETPFPETASVTEQVVEDGGLRLTLSTGLTVHLEGITAPLPTEAVQFLSVAPLQQT